MKIERLKCFISVAKNLSFTKAAQECHIAQSAISQQIISLENEVGIKLFKRTNKGVSFTPAGEVFYRDVQKLLEEYQLSIEKAKNIGKRLTGHLSIGIIGSHEAKVLEIGLGQFVKSNPGIEISFKKAYIRLLSKQLAKMDFDLVITWPYDFDGCSEFCYQCLFSRKCFANMNEKNPLAKKVLVTEKDLANQKHVIIGENKEAPLIRHYKSFFKKYPIKDEQILLVEDVSILNLMLHLNIGVSISPNMLAGRNCNVISRAIGGEPHYVELGIVYSSYNRNPVLPVFVQYMTDLFNNKLTVIS